MSALKEKFDKILSEIKKFEGVSFSKFSLALGQGDDTLIFPEASDTAFDVASLTKPIVFLSIYDKICGRKPADYLPEPLWDAKRKKQLCVEDIAEHRAGFPRFFAWCGFWVPDRNFILRLAWDSMLGAPCYSDVGYIALTYFVESFFRKRLDRVFHPPDFGLESSFWIDTESRERGKSFVKVASPVERVHDFTAFLMRGVSMHAGLFCTASDIADFCRRLLKLDFVHRRFEELENKILEGKHRFVLALDSFVREVKGGRKAILGHLGFTGCAFWIDLKTQKFAVFLSDRVFFEGERMASEKFVSLREYIIREFFFSD